jgi:hypothetical protein
MSARRAQGPPTGVRTTSSVRECRMRFARSAAAGLGVGALAGFAVALLRPRRPAPPPGPAVAQGAGTARTSSRPPRRLVDTTTTDTPAQSQAGSDFSGRVI